MKLEGKQVKLELLKPSFIKDYLKQFSPIVRSFLHVDSLEDERSYLMDQLKKQEENKTLFYCIVDKKTNNLIGALEIRDPFEHKGQLYTWINEDYWGSGFFQEALVLATTHYFQKTGKKQLNARVNVENKRSYQALKKYGFADSALVEGPHGKQFELILLQNSLKKG